MGLQLQRVGCKRIIIKKADFSYQQKRIVSDVSALKETAAVFRLVTIGSGGMLRNRQVNSATKRHRVNRI